MGLERFSIAGHIITIIVIINSSSSSIVQHTQPKCIPYHHIIRQTRFTIVVHTSRTTTDKSQSNNINIIIQKSTTNKIRHTRNESQHSRIYSLNIGKYVYAYWAYKHKHNKSNSVGFGFALVGIPTIRSYTQTLMFPTRIGKRQTFEEQLKRVWEDT